MADDGGRSQRPKQPWRQELSSFIGRAAELAAVEARLGESRLVSLTGPGGCGKSRLARRVADAQRACFAEVELVELAPVTAGPLVPATLAQALGVTDRAGASPLANLAEALVDRHVLLVLDNCEHVLADAAHVVVALLECCPGVTVLTTSRQRLDVPGEVVFPVLPLTLPAAGDRSFEAASASEAVMLFVDRARAVAPAFELTAANAEAVAEICTHLDGIPLAIELAAARAHVLSLGDMVVHLDGRFGLLEGGAVAPSRHKSLRALVQWSYDLLADDEQRALACLSVFRDGFELSAAVAVVGGGPGGSGGGGGPTPERVVGIVAGLVERSLVQVSHEAGTRYRLLETIRAFAAERLVELGGAEDARGRHLDWALGLARAAEAEQGGAEWPAWRARLAVEQANLRAALEWGLDGGDASLGRELAARLGRWWFVTGRYAEGRQFLLRALADADDDPAAIRARLLVAAGWCTYHLGETIEGEALGLHGLEVARAGGEEFLVAWAQLLAAGVAWSAADGARVEQHLAGHEAWLSIPGARPLAARAILLLSNVRFIAGDLDEARRFGREAVELANAAPGQENLALALISSTHPALVSGDLDGAEALLEEALAAATAAGDSFTETIVYYQRARLAAARGDAEGAAAEAARCWAAGRAGSVGVVAALGPYSDAVAALTAGCPAEAAAALRAAVDGGRAMAFSSFGAVWLAERACVLARLGDEPGALAAMQEAEAAVTGRQGRLVAAMLAYTRAVLAWRNGDLADAQRRAADAVAAWCDAGALLEAADGLETLGSLACARARFEDGAVLIGAADAARRAVGYRGHGPAACRQEAAEAIAAAEQALGEQTVSRLVAEGASIGLTDALARVRRGGGRKRPSVGWESLTPTEEQVVRLVAEGLRNDAIARRLYLAQGTVKNHLTHVFTKLGVTSRAELAAEAVRRGAP